MRQVVVYCRDIMDGYREEYRFGPIPGDRAEDAKYTLDLMGCGKFRVEPYKEAA